MNRSPMVSIVDADSASCRDVEKLVHTMGFSSAVYRGARGFLDECDPEQPGCVILEVQIPDIPGLQVQKELLGRRMAPPVIFLTEHATVSIVVQAFRAGAVHFLEKPFREAELWQAISDALHRDEQQRVVQVGIRRARAEISRLSQEERLLAEKIVMGKTNREIAAELGVCLRTIEFRRSRMMKKLEILQPSELVHLLHALQAEGCGELCNE